jgi:quercetin dioxygenase-like cupin family protein
MKRYVVNEAEGVKGKLPVPGGGGTFTILIDEEISGAQHFSLLVNEMAAGYKGKEHSHNVEHCWYILSGTGIIRMAGETYRIKPGDAVFAPIGMAHSWSAPEKSPSGMWSFTHPPDLRKN